MNKSTTVKIRKFARTLPVVTEDKIILKSVSGHTLIAQGVPNDKDGNPIDRKATYKFNRKVRVPVNHYKRIKALWKIHGEASLDIYKSKLEKALIAS